MLPRALEVGPRGLVSMRPGSERAGHWLQRVPGGALAQMRAMAVASNPPLRAQRAAQFAVALNPPRAHM